LLLGRCLVIGVPGMPEALAALGMVLLWLIASVVIAVVQVFS
jgi:hypothetical protein